MKGTSHINAHPIACAYHVCGTVQSGGMTRVSADSAHLQRGFQVVDVDLKLKVVTVELVPAWMRIWRVRWRVIAAHGGRTLKHAFACQQSLLTLISVRAKQSAVARLPASSRS